VTRIWDELWLNFHSLVGTLNETIRPEDAGFVVRVGRHANDTFPFRAWASYSPASSPGDEELVLSVDFKRTGPKIEGHVDLARGDGVVLAGQELGEPFNEETEAVNAAVRAADAAVQQFIATHRELFESTLRRPE
jgi:hypothetical protein